MSKGLESTAFDLETHPPGPETVVYKAVVEVDAMVTSVVTFLIKLAPVGVFFLILSNL